MGILLPPHVFNSFRYVGLQNLYGEWVQALGAALFGIAQGGQALVFMTGRWYSIESNH